MTKLDSVKQYWVGPHLPLENLPANSSPFNQWLKQPIKRHTAHLYVRLLTALGCELIGITGSVGKTTTKEMLASILSQKFRTNYTTENINPVFNIPNTILKTAPWTQKLILEMGVEYPGDMDYYLWLNKPSIGICTSVNWTHTEFFGDINGVASEKAKLITSLPKSGLAVLNKDDNNVADMAKTTKAKVVWCSTKQTADIQAANIEYTDNFRTTFTLIVGQETTNVSLPILGHQFVILALCASAVGCKFGIPLADIAKGLADFNPPPHRMVPHRLKSGRILIDDTYNANPLAVIEAIKLVSDIGHNRRKILVLATMQELGDYEESGHWEVGEYAARLGIDYIVSIGDPTTHTLDAARSHGMANNQTYLASSNKVVIEKIKEISRSQDIILVKGSRSMHMDEVVKEVLKYDQ